MNILDLDGLGAIHSRRPGMTVREVKAEDFDREALRAASVAAAIEATEAFPGYVEIIRDVLRAAFPPHVIATISNWSMVRRVGPDGVAVDGPIAGLEQHHVELLQALLLTLDRWEWGNEPAGHLQINAVIEALKSLATAFHRRRALAFEEIGDDPQRLTVAFIQERLRDNTQMVRNWGRYDDMIRIVRDVHAPLYGELAERHGFGATDLIEIADAVVALAQGRLTARITLLDDIMRGRTRKAIVHGFYERYDGLDGDPDEFLASLSRRTTLHQLRAMLQGHATNGLPLELRVEPEVIAERLGKPLPVVASAFEALSIRPGALRDSQPEHLFLANPVWLRPAIRDGEDFLFLLPQTIVGFLPEVLRGLAAEAGLTKRLERRRAEYLEREMTRVVASALPGAKMLTNAKWDWRGIRYETDLIAVIGKVVLIAEAKSAGLTEAALRGAPNSVRRHVQSLLVEPAVQSQRLQDILIAAGNGDAEAVRVAESLDLGLAPGEIERVVRLSVTLDDFSALSSAQVELKQAGWFPPEVKQPATMGLADLCTCVDILDNPLLFLHYLVGRERIQRLASIFGDELDYLGTYLHSGLDLSEVESGSHRGMFSRMSQPIDAYHLAIGIGRDAAKPRPRVQPYVSDILEKLARRRSPEWTTMGLTLLDALPPGTGDGLEDAINELAVEVARGGRGPDRPGVLLASPDSRRAVAAFHVFKETGREVIRDQMLFLADYAMQNAGSNRCVVIARMLERWDQPYALAFWAAAEDESFSAGDR